MRTTTLFVALIVLALAAFNGQSFAQTTTQASTQPAEKQDWLSTASESTMNEPEEDDESKWSFDFSTGWKDKYVSSTGEVYWKGSVQQSDLMIQFPKLKGVPGRFYVDFWHSLAYRGGFNNSGGDELDTTVGWSGDIWNGINLDVGVSYYDCAPIGRIPEGGDQLCFAAELSKEFEWKVKPLFGNEETASTITPFVRFEVPWGLKGYEDKSGFRWYPGVKVDWEFVRNWSISQKINLALDDGACGSSSATLFNYEVGLGWKVTDWLSIEPINFRVITPLTSNSGRETQTVIGSGLSFSY